MSRIYSTNQLFLCTEKKLFSLEKKMFIYGIIYEKEIKEKYIQNCMDIRVTEYSSQEVEYIAAFCELLERP